MRAFSFTWSLLGRYLVVDSPTPFAAGLDRPAKSNAPKYRLLERYVARNVNGKK